MNAKAFVCLSILALSLIGCVSSTPAPKPTVISATTNVVPTISPTITARAPLLTSTPTTAAVTATSTMVAVAPTSIVTLIGVTSTPALAADELTESPLTGTVVGKMYFPSEYIPAMNLFFQKIGTQRVITVPIAEGQHFYTATLPEGKYHAYAWLLDFGGSGAHTACTTTNACDDHTLATIAVTAHTVVTGVDVVDWYAPFGTFPLPPGAKRVGTLRGTIQYPYSEIPSMIVYARNNETGETLSVTTQRGQSTFQFDEIPVGGYYLFAWTQDENRRPFGGVYTCWQLPGTCTGHGIVTAVVRYHDTTTGMINDWSDQAIVPKP